MRDHVAAASRAPVADLRRAQDRIEELEEEVRQLRDLLAPSLGFPRDFRLTPIEEKILSAIYARAPAVVAHERIRAAVYPDPDTAPETNVIDVRVSSIRRKLKPYGIEIKNRWGEGLYLDRASAAIIAGLLEHGASPP